MTSFINKLYARLQKLLMEMVRDDSSSKQHIQGLVLYISTNRVLYPWYSDRLAFPLFKQRTFCRRVQGDKSQVSSARKPSFWADARYASGIQGCMVGRFW